MSNKQIRKYQLEVIDEKIGYASYTRVDLPKGAKVIDVSFDSGSTYLHAIVNPSHKVKERWFATFEQDMPMEDYEKKTFEYVGMVNTIPTLHVFEVHD